MSNSKKIGIAIVLLAGAGALFAVRWPEKQVVANEMNLVDVVSGQRYHMTVEQVKVLPAVNPDTGEPTLLPCHEVDGKLFVKDRYRPHLRELAEVNKHVDPKTLEVRPG